MWWNQFKCTHVIEITVTKSCLEFQKNKVTNKLVNLSLFADNMSKNEEKPFADWPHHKNKKVRSITPPNGSMDAQIKLDWLTSSADIERRRRRTSFAVGIFSWALRWLFLLRRGLAVCCCCCCCTCHKSREGKRRSSQVAATSSYMLRALSVYRLESSRPEFFFIFLPFRVEY